MSISSVDASAANNLIAILPVFPASSFCWGHLFCRCGEFHDVSGIRRPIKRPYGVDQQSDIGVGPAMLRQCAHLGLDLAIREWALQAATGMVDANRQGRVGELDRDVGGPDGNR